MDEELVPLLAEDRKFKYARAQRLGLDVLSDSFCPISSLNSLSMTTSVKEIIEWYKREKELNKRIRKYYRKFERSRCAK